VRENRIVINEVALMQHHIWESYSGGNGTKDSWDSLSQGIAYVMDFTIAKLPMSFTKVFIKCIRILVEGGICQQPLPRKLFKMQWNPKKIGFYNFVVGFIANEWVVVLTWEKTEHPHEKVEEVLFNTLGKHV